jgi:hypothetical protein
MRNEKEEMTYKARRTAAPGTGVRRRVGILCLELCLFWAATASASPAQDEQLSTKAVKFTNLFSFDGTDGQGPSSLAQGTNGSFYGTTYGGDWARVRCSKSPQGAS